MSTVEGKEEGERLCWRSRKLPREIFGRLLSTTSLCLALTRLSPILSLPCYFASHLLLSSDPASFLTVHSVFLVSIDLSRKVSLQIPPFEDSDCGLSCSKCVAFRGDSDAVGLRPLGRDRRTPHVFFSVFSLMFWNAMESRTSVS